MSISWFKFATHTSSIEPAGLEMKINTKVVDSFVLQGAFWGNSMEIQVLKRLTKIF